MKTKKFLSLVLALVMALALAVPAFAATVAQGTVYELEVGTTGATLANTDSDTSNYETIEIDGKTVTLGTPVTSNTITSAVVAEWAADSSVSSAYSNWTVGSTGTKVTFTAANAAADTSALPSGAQAQAPAPGSTDTTKSSLADLATGADVAISGTTKTPTINVVIPQTGDVVLNPYKMTFTPTGATATTSEQIVSAPQFIKSASDVALQVSVKAVAAPTTGITMATKAVTEKTTDKQVYLCLNTVVLPNLATAPTTATFPAFSKTTGAVLATGDGGTLSNVLLPAPTTAGSASYLAFHLEGNMTAAPTEAWAAADKVDATLTFTFVAAANTTAATN